VVLLSLIGRDGIFDEYTRHDISHIDSLLESLNWIVPDKSKKKMTPATGYGGPGNLFPRPGMLSRKTNSRPETNLVSPNIVTTPSLRVKTAPITRHV